MGELYLAEQKFLQRSNVVKQQRKKGAFPNHERPAALVIAHVITHVAKVEPLTIEATAEPTPPVKQGFASFSAPVSATLYESVVAQARAAATPTTPQPYLHDARVAHESIRQAQFALIRVIHRLRRESNNMSECIPEFEEILKTIQDNLPTLAQ